MKHETDPSAPPVAKEGFQRTRTALFTNKTPTPERMQWPAALLLGITLLAAVSTYKIPSPSAYNAVVNKVSSNIPNDSCALRKRSNKISN